MEKYSFKYGKSKFDAEINDTHIIHTLYPKDSERLMDIEEEVKKSLEKPIGASPLKEIILPNEKVAIVVSDVTRLWIKTNQFLIHIIDYLNSFGVEDKNISIVIALGSHRSSTEDEKRSIVGDEVYDRITIFDHDCFDNSKLCYLGESSFGTPIYLNEKIVNADRVILTGGIVFHLFAGFGGGAKSVVPGVAGIETIQYNHRLTFYEGDGTGLNPNACANKIYGNPMREDITEICRKLNPDFLFNAVLDAEGNFVRFVAGDFEKAWLQGCDTIRNLYGIHIDNKADIIVASAGGYPKDINLYQSVKTMDNCIYGGKENSVIILLAECAEGLGADEFLQWFKYETLEEMEAALKRNFTVPGYAAYKTAYTARYRKVILISSLPKEVVTKLGFTSSESLEAALKIAYSLSTENPKITLMPYGGNTLPIQ